MNKLYLIIISHVINVNIENTKTNFGLDDLKAIGELRLYEAQSISDSCCIGIYNDNLLIVSPDRVFDFYDTNISVFEKRLCESFPKSEIAVLTLNSVVNLYGYTLIENGLRKRTKSGADGDVYIDFGDKIKEEYDIGKEKMFSDEDIKEMKSEYSSAEMEKIIDNERGVRVTNRLLKRYFGTDENAIYHIFSTIQLTQYK